MATLSTKTSVCASQALRDDGEGLRFQVTRAGQVEPAFTIRYAGRVYAYLNRCAHRGVELDWDAGRFFNETRQHLICATHGALYDPQTGICIHGPCRGERLVPLVVSEAEGQVWLDEEVPVAPQ